MTDATNPGDIIVVGRRAVPKMPNIDEMETVPENPDQGGTTRGVTQEEADAENERQERCAAQDFANRLQSNPTKNDKETFSFILNRDEETQMTPPVTANGVKITQADINPVLLQHNINMTRVVGFAHNHPKNYYCNAPDNYTRTSQQDVNSYPSEADWQTAETFVETHHADANLFKLYVVGCDNVLREFPYANREYYKNQIKKDKPVRPPKVEASC